MKALKGARGDRGRRRLLPSPKRAGVFAVLLLLAGISLAAQEPRPVSITEEMISADAGVELILPWRVAAGDDPARAAVAFDDSGWGVTSPLDAPSHSVAWFRRHLRIDPDLRSRQVVLRIDAPGAVEVFLDGRPVLSSSATSGVGRSSATITLSSGSSVIAVRHRCPGCSRGFLVGIQSPRAEAARLGHSLLAIALATVPIVLALIHLGLWVSDRRARENLFLALCLASFSGIVAFSAGAELAGTYPWLDGLRRLITPSILSAVFFSLMTYYVIRRQPIPPTWVAFAVAGIALAVATAFVSENNFRNIAWTVYFVALVIEVVRLEARSATVPETGMRPLLIGMLVLVAAIVVQVLVVLRIIPDVFPWGRAYYFGLIALAVGSSLFTVNSFAMTRRKLERNEGEIASARKLQEAMLPSSLPEVPGLELAAFLSTATDVGGDYYDFRESPDGALLIAVGDAAGHGLAAGAMVTAMKALFGSVQGDENLEEILGRCDSVLRRMDLRLLHMCLALVRFRGGSIEVCSAAMPPALIHRAATGRVEELGAGGLPLGGRLRGVWESRTAGLAPGDTVLLASDGLGELLDPAGTPLGFDAVARLLERAAGGSPREVIDRINAEAARWRGKAEQADDITIVVARRG